MKKDKIIDQLRARIEALTEREAENIRIAQETRAQSLKMALASMLDDEFLVITRSGAMIKARATQIDACRESFGPTEYTAIIVINAASAAR